MTIHTTSRYTHLECAPSEAWAALTDPPRLQEWLCDRAQVDLRPGGRFALEGPSVFGDAGEQRTAAIDPGRRLAMSWPIEGVHTNVEWLVEADGTGSLVAVRHTVPGEPDFGFHAGLADSLDSVWAYYLGALKTFVESGAAAVRVSFAPAQGDAITQSIAVPCTPAVAFAAVSEPRHLDRWLTAESHVDLAVGGRFSFGWPSETATGAGASGPTTVVALDPGREVAHGWTASGLPTVVRWHVEAEGAGARITLTHSGFGGDARLLRDHIVGWADYMCTLAVYLATGAAAASYRGRLQPTEASGDSGRSRSPEAKP